jgi:histidyl-tRNA synthetase
MGKIKPRIYKGTRDFLPQQMVRRNYVINIIKATFEKYGFEPLETPTIEMWETLSGKYGEEGDRLTYRFTDRGHREVGLRYDLTVPLARVVAMYPELPKPFKRYQIQPVWRADKPQKGRFREFYQCDIDTIGSDSLLADAELLAVTSEVLNRLNFQKFTIRLNSRKVLTGIVEAAGVDPNLSIEIYRIIDKLDKIGFEGVTALLEALQLGTTAVQNILLVLRVDGENDQRIENVAAILQNSPTGLKGIEEIRQITNYLDLFAIPKSDYLFDPCLARGLDYYTGPIFETVMEEPKIGSITGGGRYDNLIGMFGAQAQPATGSSIGLERIITVMDELNMFPEWLNSATKVLVTVFDETTLPYSIKIAAKLREAGINTDLYAGSSKLRGQFGYANDKGIPFVIIAGPEEIEKSVINVKNMRSGEQTTVLLEEAVLFLQTAFTTANP